MARTTTRSDPELPDDAELARLKVSPEVAWYLVSRGIPLPACPPRWKTPEPRDVAGARFDPARVDLVLKAFGLLQHTQGEWAGRPLRPDPWQVAYIIAPVFGWVRRNAAGEWVRIIRSLYVDVPRKNGKTTLCGGIAMYLTCADGEPGAQVLAAATSERQAGYVFEPVRQLAAHSPALKGRVRALAKKIIHPRSGSYFTVVSSVAEALHGANVHGSITDELHVHRSPDLVETIETGTGSRRQPLNAIITTADDGRTETIYARKRRRIEQLAGGVLEDPTTYGVIWAAAEDDDPFAEATWAAANPGYGISPTREYLARAAVEARDSPAALATFLRLHLGIRTKQVTRYLTLEAWDRNAGLVDRAALAGREVYGGLDLGATSDLCALCWLAPDGAGGYDAVWRLWMPEANLDSLNRRTARAADVWVREGWLTLTPGNVADYDYIRRTIAEDMAHYAVKGIAYDPWNSSQLVNDLTADGAPLVQMRQGFISMSPPTKELKRLLLLGLQDGAPRIRHGGHPVLRWMVDVLAVAQDASDNVKPDKKNSGDKIDGLVALVMALDQAQRREPEQRSAYEDSNLEVV